VKLYSHADAVKIKAKIIRSMNMPIAPLLCDLTDPVVLSNAACVEAHLSWHASPKMT
jgi:hypothetical protein